MSLKDPCSCCGLVEADTELSPLAGRLVSHYVGLVGARFNNQCWNKCANSVEFAARIRVRRAQPRFYGTMPAVLPVTLPAGTRSTNGYQVDEPLVIGAYLGSQCYMRSSSPDGIGCCWPKDIDWSTVLVQEGSSAVAPAPASPIVQCRECKATASVGDLCGYCDARINPKQLPWDKTIEVHYRNVAARSRMAVADRRSAPRVSAESRQLAKRSPWEAD